MQKNGADDPYLQGESRDADIENRLVDRVGEGEGGMNWESSIEAYTLLYVKQRAGWSCSITQVAQLSALW